MDTALVGSGPTDPVLANSEARGRPGQAEAEAAPARLVQVFARRMQIQEVPTSQVADTIQEVPKPRGVGVVIEAAHQCMTTRGVRKPGVSVVTSRMLRSFRDALATRREFPAMIGSPRSGSNGC